MDANHPKRKKDKLNPYSLWARNGLYYVSFRDGEGKYHKLEISRELYDEFNAYELEDISYMNVVSRHYEHSELEEWTLYDRAVHVQASVEEEAEENSEREQLHRAIEKLPPVQRRRLSMYYFDGLTCDEIGALEGCTHQAVTKTLAAAKENLRKIFKKGVAK